MSIRRRLVLVVLGLVTVALAAIAITTYLQLDHYLTHQVDQGLERAVDGQLRRLVDARGAALVPLAPAPDDSTRRFRQPNAFYTEIRDSDGIVVFSSARQIDETAESPPAIPADVTTSTRTWYTVDSVDGSTSYRLRVARMTAGTVIVGASLADVESTLGHVLLVEIIGGVVVLVALIVLSMWLVGVGLRPLRSVERATTTIAAGDYSHRVAVEHPNTEVGALATSFNSMLEQIETSFTTQHATEDRLRRFVSDASHELKTPLTSIRGYAELYRAGVLARPDELSRAMGRIEQEAARMGSLVEDLLLLARLDEGRPIDRSPLDVVGLVADVLDDAHAVEPGREIQADVPDEPVVVLGDRARLVQVLANLLSNVRAHAGADARVVLSVRAADGRARISVADTGVGMPAEVLAHAFDRFYRADLGRSRADDHVGLGLAIVASIVQAHDGSVDADSEPGRGTTITIDLPLADARLDDAPTPSDLAPSPDPVGV